MKSHDLKKIPVTKLDAARRQLETAITLWFHDHDPVSIHTLAAAAYQLLYDLNTKGGGPPMMPDGTCIRPEHKKEWLTILRRAQNFFKHADSDAATTLFFAPQTSRALLLEGCQFYQMMAHEHRPLLRLFTLYFVIHDPRLFLQSPDELLSHELPVHRIKQLSKRDFFYELLPSAASPGAA